MSSCTYQIQQPFNSAEHRSISSGSPSNINPSLFLCGTQYCINDTINLVTEFKISFNRTAINHCTKELIYFENLEVSVADSTPEFG
jgi:hypothetical protein